MAFFFLFFCFFLIDFSAVSPHFCYRIALFKQTKFSIVYLLTNNNSGAKQERSCLTFRTKQSLLPPDRLVSLPVTAGAQLNRPTQTRLSGIKPDPIIRRSGFPSGAEGHALNPKTIEVDSCIRQMFSSPWIIHSFPYREASLFREFLTVEESPL